MSENKDHYHDTVLNLEEKLKHGLGYANPYSLKKAISPNPKLYDAACLDNSNIHKHISDTEDILEDATKSQIKMKNKFKLETFQKQFLRDIKEMKDVFDSSKRDLSETWKQNNILKDQHLEATLKHEIDCCVLLSHECVDNNMHDEIGKIQRDSIEIQEGMKKRINILENDVQRCQKQSLDFELKLQHEKEKEKCESSLKIVCDTSWISDDV
ncbi:hypothetical protein Tco_1016067 [Tanacetum coccineum]|uniref:Uncharacterized protein n=1 Tax=Tanacetum coccineum TaxID=301880 RepID=A0ABQ5FPG5_9ASTR